MKPIVYYSFDVPLFHNDQNYPDRTAVIAVIVTDYGVFSGAAIQHPDEPSDPDRGWKIALERAIQNAKGE